VRTNGALIELNHQKVEEGMGFWMGFWDGEGPCQVEPLKVLTASHTHTQLECIKVYIYLCASMCAAHISSFLAFGSHFYFFFFLDPIKHPYFFPYFNSSSANVRIYGVLCTNTKGKL